MFCRSGLKCLSGIVLKITSLFSSHLTFNDDNTVCDHLCVFLLLGFFSPTQITQNKWGISSQALYANFLTENKQKKEEKKNCETTVEVSESQFLSLCQSKFTQ